MRRILKNTILLDKVGMFISALCAVHCSVLPILLVLGLGSGFGWMLSHEVELIFLIVSLLIASFSLIEGYVNVHGQVGVLFLAVLGFVSLVVGHEIEFFAMSVFMSTLGGISILLAHLMNFRFRARDISFVANR